MTPSQGFEGVAMDTHIYQMFNNEVCYISKIFLRVAHFSAGRTDYISQQIAFSDSQHISSACSHAQDLSTFDLWVFAGEWTPAADDCGVYQTCFRSVGHVSDVY
jgi:hypothetical protein